MSQSNYQEEQVEEEFELVDQHVWDECDEIVLLVANLVPTKSPRYSSSFDENEPVLKDERLTLGGRQKPSTMKNFRKQPTRGEGFYSPTRLWRVNCLLNSR